MYRITKARHHRQELRTSILFPIYALIPKSTPYYSFSGSGHHSCANGTVLYNYAYMHIMNAHDTFVHRHLGIIEPHMPMIQLGLTTFPMALCIHITRVIVIGYI